MGSFAWRNLLTRPLRTFLALVGLSIPILGVIGLFSLSTGLRNLVGDTLSKIQGVLVLRENQPSPVFSDLPVTLGAELKAIPGVSSVAAEVWRIAPPIEGISLIGKTLSDVASKRQINMFDAIVVQGQDIPGHKNLKSAVYPKALLPKEKGGGRFLTVEDQGTNRVVISTKIAKDYPVVDPETKVSRPRQVGDMLKLGNTSFEVIGIYQTGSMFLDVVLIMDITTARKVVNFSDDRVSCYYVEMEDPSKNDDMSKFIEEKYPNVDARSMNEFMANFGVLMGQLDTFLLMTVSLALLVGIVGIVNTMLMSTTERFVEFGVLRTNGWSQRSVLALVTAESAYLGLLSGIVGCVLALVGTLVANQFISGGLQLFVTPKHFLLGTSLSVVTGVLGGLYPAWRAARMVPMDAIRMGSH